MKGKSMINVNKHLNLLGLKVKDKVTGYEGIVITIGFDLYGCIQADVRPDKVNKDGTVSSGYWLDVTRLIIVSKKPVMELPDFDLGYVSEGKKGASIKSIQKI